MSNKPIQQSGKPRQTQTSMRLLRTMKFIRHVEESIAHKYAENKMRCPTHLSTGQEAVAVGVCLALAQKDQVFSTHRAHAHYLAKGGQLPAMLAEIYGKATGCCGGKGGSMHLIDLAAGFLGSTAIVGNSLPIAVGAALTNQILRTGKVVCVFFGDAATEEGVFHESINFAALRKLPILFVCENNLFSVYSPLQVRQPPNRVIWKFAAGYGLQTAHGNGYNVREVLQMTQKALCHIRSGKGPFFLEFATYRWREHCGPNFDNQLGYRDPREFKAWQKRDSIAGLEAELLAQNPRNAAGIRRMQIAIEKEVAQAFIFAEKAPFPKPNRAAANVWAK